MSYKFIPEEIMANHEMCPIQTIINAVFSGHEGVPENIAQEVRECENCFVVFYGDHLSDDLLLNSKKQDHADVFHLKHCSKCNTRYRQMLPDKTGRSHPVYLQNLVT